MLPRHDVGTKFVVSVEEEAWQRAATKICPSSSLLRCSCLSFAMYEVLWLLYARINRKVISKFAVQSSRGLSFLICHMHVISHLHPRTRYPKLNIC